MSWNIHEDWAQLGLHAPPRAWSLSESRRYCAWLTNQAQENFSVTSLLLPRRLLKDFQAIYAFCRWADDLADEFPPDQALVNLDWWEELLLTASSDNERTHPVFPALHHTHQQYSIPLHYFQDLLSAFRQDQRQTAYRDWAELLDYCRRSADPVGRIILCLTHHHESRFLPWSDAICTGLQLVNFWQDVSRDAARGRVYLPHEDLQRYQIERSDLLSGQVDQRSYAALIQDLCLRTEPLFEQGKLLIRHLPDNIRGQIELFRLGGKAVLQALKNVHYDTLNIRPVVSPWQRLKILGATGMTMLLD